MAFFVGNSPGREEAAVPQGGVTAVDLGGGSGASADVSVTF